MEFNLTDPIVVSSWLYLSVCTAIVVLAVVLLIMLFFNSDKERIKELQKANEELQDLTDRYRNEVTRKEMLLVNIQRKLEDMKNRFNKASAGLGNPISSPEVNFVGEKKPVIRKPATKRNPPKDKKA